MKGRVEVAIERGVGGNRGSQDCVLYARWTYLWATRPLRLRKLEA